MKEITVEEKITNFAKSKEGMYVAGGIVLCIVVIVFWWVFLLALLGYILYKQEKDKNGK